MDAYKLCDTISTNRNAIKALSYLCYVFGDDKELRDIADHYMDIKALEKVVYDLAELQDALESIPVGKCYE